MCMDYYEEQEHEQERADLVCELLDILENIENCEHEMTYYVFHKGSEAEICEDCGKEIEPQGPQDDTWIQNSLERMAFA